MKDQKQELIRFWFGRKLPESFSHLANLSQLSVEDLKVLNQLRIIVLAASSIGLELDFGQRVKVNEVL